MVGIDTRFFWFLLVRLLVVFSSTSRWKRYHFSRCAPLHNTHADGLVNAAGLGTERTGTAHDVSIAEDRRGKRRTRSRERRGGGILFPPGYKEVFRFSI